MENKKTAEKIFEKTANAATIDVGMGVVRSGAEGVTLVARGVGSCVCVCMWSPEASVGGMAHVLLPQAPANCVDNEKTKYADFAIPELVEKLERNGAHRHSLKAALAGGASMFRIESAETRVNVGKKNIAAAAEILGGMGINPELVDVGGEQGRNITFDPAIGRVQVSHVKTTVFGLKQYQVEE